MSEVAPAKVRVEILRGCQRGYFDDHFLAGWNVVMTGTITHRWGDVMRITIASGKTRVVVQRTGLNFNTTVTPYMIIRLYSVDPNITSWTVELWKNDSMKAQFERFETSGVVTIDLTQQYSGDVDEIRLFCDGSPNKYVEFDTLAVSTKTLLVPTDTHDLIGSLEIVNPEIHSGVSSCTFTLPNFEGEYTEEVSASDHVIVWIARDEALLGDRLYKRFGGRITKPKYIGAHGGKDFLEINALGHGIELNPATENLQEIYSSADGQTIIEDALALASYVEPHNGHFFNCHTNCEINSTHDEEIDEEPPLKVIQEIMDKASNPAATVGFDGFIHPSGAFEGHARRSIDHKCSLILGNQATFGNKEVGAGQISLQDTILGSYFETPEITCEAQKIFVYLDVNHAGLAAKCAIYKKSDGTLIGSTQEKQLGTGEKWYEFTFSPSVTLEAATEYWLVVWAEYQTPISYVHCDPVTGALGLYSYSYSEHNGVFPSTWSPSIDNYQLSIYCELQIDGEPFEEYEKTDDALRMRNKVNVYGKATKNTGKDVWTEALTNWASYGTRSLSTERVFGEYSIETTRLGYFEFLRRTNLGGIKAKYLKQYQELVFNFYWHEDAGYGPPAEYYIRLWAPDVDNSFTRTIRSFPVGGNMPPEGQFTEVRLPVGPGTGWYETGNPDWENIEAFEVYLSWFAGSFNITIRVDGLHFDGARFSGSASDYTSQLFHGVKCDKPIVDDSLTSDQECALRAQSIRDNLKDILPVVENLKVNGSRHYWPALMLRIYAEKSQLDQYFRIIQVRDEVKGPTWDVILTLSNEPVTVDYLIRKAYELSR